MSQRSKLHVQCMACRVLFRGHLGCCRPRVSARTAAIHQHTSSGCTSCLKSCRTCKPNPAACRRRCVFPSTCRPHCDSANACSSFLAQARCMEGCRTAHDPLATACIPAGNRQLVWSSSTCCRPRHACIASTNAAILLYSRWCQMAPQH